MIAVGIDIGATNVKIVNVDYAGNVLADANFPTTDRWADEIKATVEGERGAVGVAAPGIASPDGKTISWMFGRMAGLVDFDWAAHLGRPRVPVLNDAQAALLGECWIGAARGAQNAVMLTLGSGVGGAILCDGRLLRGHIGRAGHLGHMTVDSAGAPDAVNTPGSLEDAIGEYTLQHRSNGRFTTTKDLLAAVRANDADARQVWLSSIRALGAAIASIINAVDPEVVILGGGVAQAGATLFELLAKVLDEFEWRPNGHRVPIVPAQLGDRAGALGAAGQAVNEESST